MAKKQPQKPKRQKHIDRSFSYFRIIRIGLAAAIWLGFGLSLIVVWYAYDLPEIAARGLETRRNPSVTLLAADGSQLLRLGDLYGAPVDVKKLPPHIPRAVVAIEDSRFYKHPGIDLVGIARAFTANIAAGRYSQGGSTITQQLAKNLFLTRKKTLRRKIREMLLAFWLEYKLTKDQILTVYLNRTYFGAGAYGLNAAADRYFAKPAARLTHFEAAVLAGLLKAPSRDNPLANPQKAAARANVVLARMADLGWVPLEKLRSLQNVTVKTAGQKSVGNSSRYFTDWVMSRLESVVGFNEGDLIVRTTLNPAFQQTVQNEVERAVGQNKARNVGQAAAVMLSADGAVRAMVGGENYNQSQFNRVVQAQRQPGSVFKLFVYLTALENGIRPDDRFLDEPINIAGWAPRNAGGVYHGNVTMTEAFALSLNSVAVQVAEQVGRDAVIEMARRLELSGPLKKEPSLALGVFEQSLMELTGAYAVVANGGRSVWPYGVLDVRDGQGRVLYQHDEVSQQVVSSAAASHMAELLASVVDWGTGKAARMDVRAIGKTGTTQNFRDAWFIGETGGYVAGIWVGNDDNSPMKNVTGGSLPAQIWKRIMARSVGGRSRPAIKM